MLLPTVVEAQKNQKLLDSLHRTLQNAGNDTIRMETYNLLGWFYEQINPDSTLYYAEEQMKLARRLNQKLEEAGAFINKINRAISNNDTLYWGIIFKDDNKLIGTICLWNIQPENYRAEIGYELHPDFWGKGIMKEAINAVVDYGFAKLGLHSIEALLNPENIGSSSVLESTGFVKEGHIKENFYFNGKFSDTAIYSKLK